MKRKIFQIISLPFLLFLLFTCKTEEKRELKGYRFDNEYVEIGVKKPENLKGSITIDLYLMLHDYPTTWTGIASKFKTIEQCEFNLRLRDKDLGQWFYGDGINRPIVLDFKPIEVLPLNQWIRVTAVRDISNNYIELIIDGKSVAKRTFSKLPDSAVTDKNILLFIHGKRTLNATLAELRIWSKALNKDEINNTAGSITKPHKQKELEGYWQFDSIENGLGFDKSGNGLDAVIKKVK